MPGIESNNGQLLNRSGVIAQSQQRRIELAQMMRRDPYQHAVVTVRNGPRAIVGEAGEVTRANLEGIQQIVNHCKGLDQDPASGWQLLRQMSVGNGRRTIGHILDALTADVPSQPGERPSRAASLFLTHRRVRSSVRGEPAMDRYNVNVGNIRRVRGELELLQRGVTQEQAGALQSVIEQLNAYESMDPQRQVLANIDARSRTGGSAEGLRFIGRASTALVSGLVSAVSIGIGVTSGTFSPLMVIGPALTYASLYPGAFNGRLRTVAERSGAVVQSPIFQQLAPQLGGVAMQQMLDVMRTASMGSRSAVGAYLREVGRARNGRGALRPETVQAFVDAVLPEGSAPAAARAQLLAIATNDPVGMATFVTRARRARDQQSQQVLADVNRAESATFSPAPFTPQPNPQPEPQVLITGEPIEPTLDA